MNAVAATSGLGFAYGGSRRCVLEDVNVEVRDGELILAVGPSGGGKSTLLRCFNGLVPHFHGGRFRGRVLVGGLDTRDHQPRDLACVAGLVFQEPEAQRVARTVKEDIVFGMENQGTPPMHMRKRLEETLDALGIAHLRDQDMQTLSGGELQRVAIASVLTMQPRLILMDEPTSQLDPQAADDVLRLVRDLRDDYGVAIVIAEHRLDRIAAHVDTVWHLSGDGHVEELEPREAAGTLPGAPAVSRIGQALGWSPVPLSLAEARKHLPGVKASHDHVECGSPNQGGEVASVHGASVELGGRTVLSIDSLTLHEGEAVGLMGRNGAGKTTLLRALAGLVPLQSGSVTGAGDRDASSRFRNLAFVPQDPGATLYRQTVEEEIIDVLRGTGRDGDVEEALAMWDLAALRDRDPRDLSVGERQRAALCAPTAGDPRLILLDEPTRGMDAAAKQVLLRNIEQFTRSGACVIVASHDVELVASFAQRVVLLAEGEIIADGPARSVLTGSFAFSTQANKLCGGGILTVDEAIAHLRTAAL